MVVINKFYGWMSDTSSIVYDGQFPYWEGLDLSSLQYITPNPDAVKGNSVWTGNWNTLLDCSEGTDSDKIFAFGYSWTTVAVKYMTWTTVISETNASTSMNAILYNGNVIWATNQSKELTLNKIAISDTDEATARWGQPSQSSWWKTGNTAEYETNEISMLVWNNTLLVWYGKSLWRLNASDTREELIDDMQDDIIDLTSANTFIRIYTRDWQVLTYDGASSNVDYTTNLKIGRTVDVFWVRGTDYVITHTNQLLVSNWLDYQSLKKAKNYDAIDWTVTKFKFDWGISSNGPWAMIEYRWLIYWVTKNSITSRGTLENGMPTAFNKDILPRFTVNDIEWTITDILWLCKWRNWETMYFMCKGTWDWNAINYIYSYKKDKDTTAWSLAQVYSPKFLFGRTKRLNNELYIRADVDVDNYIVTYYKVNWWSWVERQTLNEDLKSFIINKSLTCNELEVWIKLVGSPKVYDYDFNPLPEWREWQT